MSVKPIPDGYHSVTPHLIVQGAAAAIEFYQRAFNAVELFRVQHDGGVIGHAEIQIGNSRVMLADEFPQMNVRGPKAYGGSPASLMIYVEDVDGVVTQAVSAGATIKRPVQNQFYGDRTGTIEDPFGHQWTISTHVEDVPHEELAARAAAAHGATC